MQKIISNTKSIKIVIAQHVLACNANFLKYRNYLEECSRNTVRSLTPVAAQRGKPKEHSPLPKPEKFAKDGEQSTPQPAWESIVGKFSNFSLNFSKILLKFYKTHFKIFLKLLKFLIKLSKFVQTLTVFLKSQSLTLFTIQYT